MFLSTSCFLHASGSRIVTGHYRGAAAADMNHAPDHSQMASRIAVLRSDTASSEATLLKVARDLAHELHPRRRAARRAGLDSSLDRDWGFDSLSRAELGEHTVGEVMSRRVFAVDPEESVRAAARLMAALQIHRVLVLEQGKLVGLLSSMDLVRAVADGRT